VIVIVWIIAQVLIIKAVVFAHILYIGWGAGIILLSLLPSVRSHYRVSVRTLYTKKP